MHVHLHQIREKQACCTNLQTAPIICTSSRLCGGLETLSILILSLQCHVHEVETTTYMDPETITHTVHGPQVFPAGISHCRRRGNRSGAVRTLFPTSLPLDNISHRAALRSFLKVFPQSGCDERHVISGEDAFPIYALFQQPELYGTRSRRDMINETTMTLTLTLTLSPTMTGRPQL